MKQPSLVSRENAHQNRWYQIDHDRLSWEGGKETEYFVLHSPPVVIIVSEKDGKLLFIEQYRYPIDKLSLEFPMGSANKNESLLESAQRELKEETGYEAKQWKSLGSFHPMSGISDRMFHVFYASDLQQGEQALEVTEIVSGLQTKWLTPMEWKAKVAEGLVSDGTSLAAWCLYQTHLNT